MDIIWIVIAVIAVLLIICYNTLVKKRNQVDNAFASIDVMLKKRFDLIPNLVATVQQYAKHEQETFAKVIALRNTQYSSLSQEEKASFDATFTQAGEAFFALAENYPELKASENFSQLQRSLNETEEQLSAARRTYNASVTDYNNAVQVFPTNLIAGMMGFSQRELLAIPEEERRNPNIKDLFNS